MIGSSVVVFIVTFAAFSLSGLLFRIDPAWYARLKKPSWTPSGATIGGIWVTLYACIALATTLVVLELPVSDWPFGLVLLVLTNWFFNQTFSFWMFARKNLHAAFLTALLTCITAYLLVLGYGGVRLTAGLLLVPYAAWTTIASVLAWSIYRANK
jgi:tryptophan-rich sensory protein